MTLPAQCGCPLSSILLVVSALCTSVHALPGCKLLLLTYCLVCSVLNFNPKHKRDSRWPAGFFVSFQQVSWEVSVPRQCLPVCGDRVAIGQGSTRDGAFPADLGLDCRPVPVSMQTRQCLHFSSHERELSLARPCRACQVKKPELRRRRGKPK